MSKHYPSRRRARKAYARGVKHGRQRLTHIHPYINARLAGIYAKGLAAGMAMVPFTRRRSVRSGAGMVRNRTVS
jgi:hypothetical protein